MRRFLVVSLALVFACGGDSSSSSPAPTPSSGGTSSSAVGAGGALASAGGSAGSGGNLGGGNTGAGAAAGASAGGGFAGAAGTGGGPGGATAGAGVAGSASGAGGGAGAGAAPITTVVRVHYPVAAGSALAIRGNGGALTWTTGAPMKAGADDTWTYATTAIDKASELKPLLDDATWSRGPNYHVTPGATVDLYPHFTTTTVLIT